MINFPDRKFIHDLNRAVQNGTVTGARLWVVSSRLIGDLSLSVGEFLFQAGERWRNEGSEPRLGGDSDRQWQADSPKQMRNKTREVTRRDKSDSLETLGRSAYDVSNALFRAAENNSDLLRRWLVRYYDKY